MTRPEVSVSKPPRMLMSVVFPEPEGPISATHSPPWMPKLTPLSARSGPYCLIRFSIITCCIAVCGYICATELTLHLEKPMPGGCSPAAAAERRSGLPQKSFSPLLQDTQSTAAAPPLQKRLCPIPSRETCLPRHQSNRQQGQAALPLPGTAVSLFALPPQWPSSGQRPSYAPSPRLSSMPSRTTPRAAAQFQPSLCAI